MTVENSSALGALPPEQNPFYKNQQKKLLSRIGLGLLMYTAVTAFLQAALMVVSEAVFPSFYHSPLFDWILQIVPSYFVAFPLFCLFLAGMPKKAPEKNRLGGENSIAFLAISFLFVLVGNLISTALMSGFEALRGQEISNVVDTYMDSYSPLFTFVLFVILAPIVEEIMFRKLVMDRLLPYSERLAVITCALIFGLIHGNFYQFFYAVLLGALFSIVYVKTGKLRYTIIMHMIINFTGSTIASFLAEATSDQVTLASSINPWVMVAGIYSMATYLLAGCGLIFLILKWKKLNLSKVGDRYLTLGTQFKLAWGNVGMILFAVFSGITFIFSIFI